ncbi:MAG: carbon-nitrogen hydrolase family protein [Solirubrobacterales bacterium]
MTKVAVVQAASVGFDPDATLDKAEGLVATAAAAGADLVVFPEAFLGGYPKGSAFGAVVGAREPSGFGEFGRYAAGGSELPGPTSERLGGIAAAAGVHLSSGVIERRGGTLYSSAVLLDDRGELLAVRRKLMPTGAERLVWGFADGSTIDVQETALGRIGTVICWESYMPLLRSAMYAKGVELYIAPTADSRDRWLATVRHIALEGRCYVISANQFARRADLPADHPGAEGEDGEAVLAAGGSCVVDPFGEVIAGPVHGEEAILYAEVDLARVAEAKYDFDPVGHYSRPDVFQLRVDVTPRPPVSFLSAPEPEDSLD